MTRRILVACKDSLDKTSIVKGIESMEDLQKKSNTQLYSTNLLTQRQKTEDSIVEAKHAVDANEK
ncbi:MAG: hypothetical protein RRZ24_09210 [Clostridia bacterium]